MFATARDDDLARLVGETVLAFMFVRDGLAQFRNARRRSVFCKTVIERFDGGVFDVLRCVEIGLADAKADDVDSIGLHLFGFGINGQSDGRSQ